MNLKVVKGLIVIGMAFALNACHSMPSNLKPGAWILDQMPQDAPENFKQGWQDGCKSGMASMSNTYYKMHYQFSQNEELRNDPVYYKAWKDTFNFCRHYAYGTLRQANVRMRLSMEPNMFQNNAGTTSIFNSGILNNLGPGTQGLFLQNWGYTGGNKQGPLESMGGVLDFSDDMVGGSSNMGAGGIWNWDFRPTNTSIVPYHTDP